MTTKLLLKGLFAAIFISMVVYTSWASLQQPVTHWQGLIVGPDRFWTIATLLDAYFGFITSLFGCASRSAAGWRAASGALRSWCSGTWRCRRMCCCS